MEAQEALICNTLRFNLKNVRKELQAQPVCRRSLARMLEAPGKSCILLAISPMIHGT